MRLVTCDDIRVIRFLRLWRNRSKLHAVLDQHEEYVVPEATGEVGRHTRRLLNDEEDVFVPTRGTDSLTPDEISRVTALDLVWMVKTARDDGIPMMLITYGLPGGWFAAANGGIRHAATETGAPLIERGDAVRRLRKRLRDAGVEVDRSTFYDRSVHPTQEVYEEVGDLIVERLDEDEILHPLPDPDAR